MGTYVWLFIGALGLVCGLTVIIHASHRRVGTHRSREVLPSHYSSLLNTDPSRIPGHCTVCGADNEPEYRYCEDCGSEIPTSGTTSYRTDVKYIFNE